MKSETLRKLEFTGLAALVVVTIVGFALWPSYPNYDSVYSLVWGSELLGGSEPSFEAFRAPTQHPLAIAVAILLWPLGGAADHALVLLTLLAFVAVVAAVYRLGRDAFAPLVGLAAALIMISRFDFPFLAVRAYIDIPFMALVLWAAVLEYQRPRRGGVVWVLLAAAGLLRPEAWALLGLYWLWLQRRPRGGLAQPDQVGRSTRRRRRSSGSRSTSSSPATRSTRSTRRARPSPPSTAARTSPSCRARSPPR